MVLTSFHKSILWPILICTFLCNFNRNVTSILVFDWLYDFVGQLKPGAHFAISAGRNVPIYCGTCWWKSQSITANLLHSIALLDFWYPFCGSLQIFCEKRMWLLYKCADFREHIFRCQWSCYEMNLIWRTQDMKKKIAFMLYFLQQLKPITMICEQIQATSFYLHLRNIHKKTYQLSDFAQTLLYIRWISVNVCKLTQQFASFRSTCSSTAKRNRLTSVRNVRKRSQSTALLAKITEMLNLVKILCFDVERVQFTVDRYEQCIHLMELMPMHYAIPQRMHVDHSVLVHCDLRRSQNGHLALGSPIFHDHGNKSPNFVVMAKFHEIKCQTKIW